MELYSGSYTFITEYILCTYPHQKVKKTIAVLELEKWLALCLLHNSCSSSSPNIYNYSATHLTDSSPIPDLTQTWP